MRRNRQVGKREAKHISMAETTWNNIYEHQNTNFFFPRESERKRKRKEKKREACTSYEKKVKDLKKEVYEMKMKKRAVDGKWQPTSHLLLTHTCISLILNFLKPPVSAAISLSSFLQLLSLSLSLCLVLWGHQFHGISIFIFILTITYFIAIKIQKEKLEICSG